MKTDSQSHRKSSFCSYPYFLSVAVSLCRLLRLCTSLTLSDYLIIVNESKIKNNSLFQTRPNFNSLIINSEADFQDSERNQLKEVTFFSLYALPKSMLKHLVNIAHASFSLPSTDDINLSFHTP